MFCSRHNFIEKTIHSLEIAQITANLLEKTLKLTVLGSVGYNPIQPAWKGGGGALRLPTKILRQVLNQCRYQAHICSYLVTFPKI